MEQTVVLIKPDGVKRGLIGEIIHRFERMSLKIVAMKMVIMTDDVFHKHYGTDKDTTIQRLGNKTLETYTKYGKDAKKDLGTDDPKELGKMVVGWLKDYIQSGPVVAMLVDGRHAVDNVKALAGPTMPVQAQPGTIRGDYSTDSAAYANAEKRGVCNLIHISGSLEEANFEKTLWFTPQEVQNYKRAEEFV
ncbi:MAG: nucleoside-diphosphate kinase [Candidatus Levybacteria bacterium CG_4_10_14_0_8_um_filter_35_23]|nr:MAG: nucleoside-diphosphate kinase [Candidatus Levybacteria bacterium CG_4_10_14_0_8_um_filter_35_23]